MRRLVLVSLFLAASSVLAESLLVFVGVPPLETLARQVGGRHTDVRTLVGPGFDPHSYEPTPRQIGALAGADLYIGVGLPFEVAWMARIRAANPRMQVLDALTGMDAQGTARWGDPHTAHDKNPHPWTSPPVARRMAGAIRDRLVALDPAHASDYAGNFAVLAAELDALDREIRDLLSPLAGQRFIVHHPAWGDFADTYGLIQVAIEVEGKEPGARALAGTIDLARREGISTVFVQPQIDQRPASQVARAIGAELALIDPLAVDYVDNLRQVAHRIARALQR